jgi:hypothetical protein
MRPNGPSTPPSSKTANVREAGTNVSSIVTSWLPVPHSPDTIHVSIISISAAGSTIIRIGARRVA